METTPCINVHGSLWSLCRCTCPRTQSMCISPPLPLTYIFPRAHVYRSPRPLTPCHVYWHATPCVHAHLPWFSLVPLILYTFAVVAYSNSNLSTRKPCLARVQTAARAYVLSHMLTGPTAVVQIQHEGIETNVPVLKGRGAWLM